MDPTELINDANRLEEVYLKWSSRLTGESRVRELDNAKAFLDFLGEPYENDSNAVILSAAASCAVALKKSLQLGRPNLREELSETLNSIDDYASIHRAMDVSHTDAYRRK